jgi:methenyltetrahydromethanopterin cyclohydrolase
VGIFVNADQNTIEQFGPHVPSSASADYGQPFAEIFKRYDHDFYRIDPMLFSPAEIAFCDASFDRPGELRYGKLAPEVLMNSFGRGK